MNLPDKCWTVRIGRKVVDRIPDNGTLDSANDLLHYMRNDKSRIRYSECSTCEKCP